MADLSNKALSLLLLVAIAVSLFGTVLTFNKLSATPSPTGRVTTSGITGISNFSISNNLSIIFTNNLIPFGTGYANTSMGNCTMGTNSSNPSSSTGCIGFNTTVANANLTLQNNGNIPANVSINFTKNASTFIGGNGSLFKYAVRNAQASACTTLGNGSSGGNPQMRDVTGTDINTTMSRICTTLSPNVGQNTIDIAIWVQVPSDAPTGLHNVTITAVACDDGSC